MRVVKTVLRLKNEMSPGLKKISQQTKRMKEQLASSRKEVDKLKAVNNRAKESIKSATSNVKKMSSQFETNRRKIGATVAQLNKLKSKTGLSSKQLVNHNNKVAIATAKLRELEAIEGSLTSMIKKANSTIKKNTKIISGNDKRISYLTKKMGKLSKKMKDNIGITGKYQKKLDGWRKAAIKNIGKVISKTAKLGATMGLAMTALATKTGLSEAMDMEGYKVQLTTAVKDTKKAGELMVQAVEFANSTPFETGSVVEATAKMEAYGISSKKWLADVADMAGATNKSIDQATEAMADATMGEFERLKEFGIKKDMLLAASNKMYGKDVVFNAKGQVKDQIKLQEVLQKVMRSKFKGGAEALSKTTKGLWSTVTGITKSSLGTIVGMQTDGTIKQGSLYERLQKVIKRVADTLLKWQKDGTIQKIGEQVTSSVMKMISIVKTVISFVIRFRTLLETIGVVAMSVYIAVKAYETLGLVMKGVAFVSGVLNGTLTISPLGWIAMAIGAVVGALYLLWRNIDTVIGFFKELWDWIKNLIGGMNGFEIALTGPLAPILLMIKHFEKLKNLVSGAFGWMKKLLGIGDKTVDVTAKKITEHTEKVTQKKDKTRTFTPTAILKKYTSQDTGAIRGNQQAQITAPSQNQGISIIIKGDIYGYEDFKEKVAQGLHDIMKTHGQNVVV